MTEWIKELFHKHEFVYTSREFIGQGVQYSNNGCCVDVDPVNIYLTKGYCIKCNKTFIEKQEILKVFDRKQPYDKEVQND